MPVEKKKGPARIVYAGDRELSVRVLKLLLEQGHRPLALMVTEESKASHAKELISLCSFLPKSHILIGNSFRTDKGVQFLHDLKPDYVFGIHFPYLIPKQILEIPTQGVLNLHPAYLPFNRGWHTPSWAIWDQTPYGATLHFMDEGIDSGDIILQERLEIRPNDTADSLYKRILQLEYEVFQKAWPSLASFSYSRTPQPKNTGNAHSKKDLTGIQQLDLNKKEAIGDTIRRFRALTTNDPSEAATFLVDKKMYRVQIKIIEDSSAE